MSASLYLCLCMCEYMCMCMYMIIYVYYRCPELKHGKMNHEYIMQVKHLLYYVGSVTEVNLKAMYSHTQR